MSVSHIRQVHQSTALRAFWTAFNGYSNPGFSAYGGTDIYEDIDQALRAYRRTVWGNGGRRQRVSRLAIGTDHR